MSEIIIDHLITPAVEQQLREIFFETSSKKRFKDVQEKEAFYWKYLGYYLTHHRGMVFIAKGPKVLGYCLGMMNSLDKELVELQTHMKIFSDELLKYPAHFHINCHADARGQGIGRKLLLCFERELHFQGIAGVHLITSTEARNRSFYSRLGYLFEVERCFEGQLLLLMGKNLTTINV
jgi:GNAT superfamily N-acetyltransferase